MRLVNTLHNLMRNIASSRTAQIFFFIHLILLLVALIKKGFVLFDYGHYQNGQMSIIHYSHEVLLFQILTVINIPVTIIVDIILLPLLWLTTVYGLQENEIIRHGFIIIIFLSWQIQWALIGFWLEKLYKHWRQTA